MVMRHDETVGSLVLVSSPMVLTLFFLFFLGGASLL